MTEQDNIVVHVLQPFIERGELVGAVTLVANVESVVCLETVGYADLAAKTPMSPDTMFWIASQSKPITAAAFMMLVDEGLVNIEDRVDKYLPEFSDMWLIVEADAEHRLLKRPSHPITVREILSHTSGMSFRSPMEEPALDGLPLRDAARSYAITPLEFEPGSKYQYSNAGINTAGRIIEVVSGMAYEKFLATRLFEPLGMTDTTFWPSSEQLSRLATAYRPNAEQNGLEAATLTQFTYPLDGPGRYPMPAGGLFSTAGDCARFCRMILNEGVYEGKRYLTEASVRLMASRHTNPALPESYGLGWAVVEGSCSHGGALSTNMTVDFTHGIVSVFLIQHAGFLGEGGNAQAAFNAQVQKLFWK